MREHKCRLIAWLKDINLPDGDTVEEQKIKILASGPSSQVTSWQGYDINGYLFYTSVKDKKIVSQNCGVYHKTGENTTYYGVIDDIWELHYGSNITMPVFRCHSVKHPKCVQMDRYGLTMVDLKNVGYKDDPWVLGSHVGQVMYVVDSANKTHHVVVPGNKK
jgi:hypothetical protein